LKVALDIHQFLMLKNKIYNYFFNEIFKNFIVILLTFTAIAWAVRAVNFLDLIVVDGFSALIYFQYTSLKLSSIMTRFIPLSFLLSLTISIVKFERQQEFLILWTTGLSKIKIVNIFLVIGFLITLIQLLLSSIINPYFLNKSRSILSNAGAELNTVLKSNDYIDIFEDLTFYIEKKNSNNELINIFIKDEKGQLNALVDDFDEKKNSTIIAKKGFITENKIVLFNGMIQTLNKKNEIKNILFEKTELSLKNMTTRTIKQPKIQETSSWLLLDCALNLNQNLDQINCSKDFKNEVIQNLSRRLGGPLYIPLISIITSFLLIYKKEKTYNFLKKYVLFVLSFVILISSEILLKYTSLYLAITIFYFIFPLILAFLFYIYLLRKIITEKNV
jgi:lipopolysaccharide export LptBFGC system permease protein LptF